MESSRITEEGKAQKHMAVGPTDGHAKIRKDMATAEGSGGLLWMAYAPLGSNGHKRKKRYL